MPGQADRSTTSLVCPALTIIILVTAAFILTAVNVVTVVLIGSLPVPALLWTSCLWIPVYGLTGTAVISEKGGYTEQAEGCDGLLS